VRGEKDESFCGNEIQKTPPVVPWRIQKSINGVTAEFDRWIIGDRNAPEIAILKDKKEERLEDFEKVEALRFGSAGTQESEGQRNKAGESEKFWESMDKLILMV
jgi:hypothetical protein